jgi:hypothetical protein
VRSPQIIKQKAEGQFAPKGALCAGTAKAEGEKQERPDFRPASPYENKQRKSSY